MTTSLGRNFGRLIVPLSAVVTAAMAGVVFVGSQSPAPATAAVQTPAMSSAELAAFKPFADEPAYKSPVQTVYPTARAASVTYIPAPVEVGAPSTALPVYGNIVNQAPIFVEHSTRGSDSTTGVVAPSVARPAASLASLQASDSSNITVQDATITVGTATINVLSSFKLNYGGKTVLTGNNGQTSAP